MSQDQEILNHLEEGNSITAIEALHLFRCFRLASRISGLRKKGHKIQSKPVQVLSGKRIKEYWIERPIPTTLFPSYGQVV